MSNNRSEPLISVLVLCYNNQQYIYQTLRSIFDQTYPNIEILIGDDASEVFNAEPLINWINKYKTANVKKIAIYENKINVGTVANIENLQQKSSGKYLLQIAADDALHNPHVIEKAYQKAEELGEAGEMIIGQTEMWDVELKKKLHDFVSPETIAFLEDSSAEDVFAESSYRVILPACYLYRRTLLDKVGKLSDCYRLVEDWPTHLRMTRQGIKPYYLDGVSFLKHRDGGISHGNTVQSQRAFLTYYEDILALYPNEVQPYESLLSDADRERAAKYYQDRLRAYYTIHVKNYRQAMQEAEKTNTILNKPAPSTVKPSVPPQNITSKQIVRQFVKDKLYRCSRKNVILFTLCYFMLLLGAAFVTEAFHAAEKNLLDHVIIALSAFAALILEGEIALNALLRIRSRKTK